MQLHDKLLWIIIIISIFVLGLLVYVMVRFNEKRNPTPSRTTHNTLARGGLDRHPGPHPRVHRHRSAESSFRLLYFADRAPDAAMTVKAIGHQWYWTYEYPDNGGITLDANLNDKAPPELRLLETDNHVVVPVNTKVRLLTTANDVIHSWAMPSFGVKLDAVPGRINETWFQVAARGHLLRPVLGAVRRQPRLHADRRRGGQQGQVRRLGPGEEGGHERRRARHGGRRGRQPELMIREGSKR